MQATPTKHVSLEYRMTQLQKNLEHYVTVSTVQDNILQNEPDWTEEMLHSVMTQLCSPEAMEGHMSYIMNLGHIMYSLKNTLRDDENGLSSVLAWVEEMKAEYPDLLPQLDVIAEQMKQ